MHKNIFICIEDLQCCIKRCIIEDYKERRVMPKVIDPAVRSKAIILREEGKSYKDISDELGVSPRWVAKELSGIKTHKQKTVEDLCAKSKTKYGVSKGEIYYNLKLHELDKQEGASEMKNVTQKIKQSGDGNLVRPDWMFPMLSQFVTKRVLRFVIEAEDRFEEEAQELHNILLDSCRNEEEERLVPSVKRLKATYAHLMNMLCDQSPDKNMKVQSYIDSIQTTALALQERNPNDFKPVSNTEYKDAGLIELESVNVPY